MGCGASSAKPAELSPPARAAAAKSKLEELKNPKSVAPAASGQAAIDPRLQQDNRAALGTSATPAVKKYALTEDFYKPHTPSDVFKYGRIVAPNKAAISELFQKLDKESKGSVAKGDLRNVVAKYQGAEFDEKQFFGWYDVHGRSTEKGPGGSIDLREFGLYLAEVALAFGGETMAESALALIIQQLTRHADGGSAP